MSKTKLTPYGKKFGYSQKVLVTRNTHVKYQIPSTHKSKDETNMLKFSKSESNTKVKVIRSNLLDRKHSGEISKF
jgi:hypothetical protein